MHIPVLDDEVIDNLSIKPAGRYLDVTGGEGGHDRKILASLAGEGKLLISDCDRDAVENLKRLFKDEPRVKVFHARFSEIARILREHSLLPVDGVLADLGFSSGQMEKDAKGLSFTTNQPLDMRLDCRLETTAADLLREMTEENLARLFFEYGEERYARRLARAIVADRGIKPFLRTTDLAGLCERVLGRFYRKRKIHPATRAFQAMRIAVNHELKELRYLLEGLPDMLQPQGRAAIISFHSLEDRMVKNEFKKLKNNGWNMITKKPLTAGREEISINPRSRSAKMRVIEK